MGRLRISTSKFPLRSEEKNTLEPSPLQTGMTSSVGPVVNLIRLSRRTCQIQISRLSPGMSTAMRVPSGDTRGLVYLPGASPSDSSLPFRSIHESVVEIWPASVGGRKTREPVSEMANWAAPLSGVLAISTPVSTTGSPSIRIDVGSTATAMRFRPEA